MLVINELVNIWIDYKSPVAQPTKINDAYVLDLGVGLNTPNSKSIYILKDYRGMAKAKWGTEYKITETAEDHQLINNEICFDCFCVIVILIWRTYTV